MTTYLIATKGSDTFDISSKKDSPIGPIHVGNKIIDPPPVIFQAETALKNGDKAGAIKLLENAGYKVKVEERN